MSKKSKICVYCLKTVENITKDHIPPKCITPSKYKEDFLTVPACYECNQKYSLEDEHFKIKTLLREDISDHPELTELTSTLLNRFNHPSKYWDGFLADIKPIDLFDEKNRFIERKIPYTVDYRRIEKFFVRLVRGLHYIDFKKYIPSTLIEQATDMGQFDTQPDSTKKVLGNMYYALQEITFKNRTGILKYRYRIYPKEHDLHSLWNIVMYDRLNFLVMLIKKNRPHLDKKINLMV